ncbi:MAG: gamma-glutamyltransferase [Deltaproteobacteria bacterium]|nr:gamma-glutamyltransferase [Deltaproteobacteria bacterium]
MPGRAERVSPVGRKGESPNPRQDPFFGLLIVFLFVVVGVASATIPTKIGKEIMIASDHKLAGKAGLIIHEKGGNIIDVAVAASFAISVVKPYSTGIGGGGFLLYYDADSQKTHAFDFRERAPRKVTRTIYLHQGKPIPESHLGPRAVAVPGVVAGLVEIHQRFGRLPLAIVMEPAIHLADEGFLVYPDFQRMIEKKKKWIEKDPALKDVLMPNGKVPRVGELFLQKDLAQTLCFIANEGARPFYEGVIARKIDSWMRQQGGLMNLQDLQHYRVKEREPVSGEYRGYRIVSMSPPSSGGIHILQMLKMLEAFPLEQMKPKNPDFLHLLAEVMRRAYRDRAVYLGDPDFFPVPQKRLLSPDYIQKQSASIDLTKATDSQEIPLSPIESHGTTHLSIVDRAGNAVATTQTINTGFGALVMVPGTGIILNNEMDDFSIAPGVPNQYGLVGSEANAIAPGKTPLSSMSPTLVFKEGHVVLAAGAQGGSHIITGVLQMLLQYFDFRRPIGQAVAAPRIHHQFLPDEILLEKKLSTPKILSSLKKKGHSLDPWEDHGANVNVVVSQGGQLTGVTDPRGTGKPVGQ